MNIITSTPTFASADVSRSRALPLTGPAFGWTLDVCGATALTDVVMGARVMPDATGDAAFNPIHNYTKQDRPPRGELR